MSLKGKVGELQVCPRLQQHVLRRAPVAGRARPAAGSVPVLILLLRTRHTQSHAVPGQTNLRVFQAFLQHC